MCWYCRREKEKAHIPKFRYIAACVGGHPLRRKIDSPVYVRSEEQVREAAWSEGSSMEIGDARPRRGVGSLDEERKETERLGLLVGTKLIRRRKASLSAPSSLFVFYNI